MTCSTNVTGAFIRSPWNGREVDIEAVKDSCNALTLFDVRETGRLVPRYSGRSDPPAAQRAGGS